MTISQALISAIKKLKSKSIKTSALDAEVLLAFVLNKPKAFLYTYPEKNLTQDQLNKFQNFIKRHLKGEPIAYLRGFKEFYGLKFIVNKNVLIPRPETELLAEEVISSLRAPRRGAKQSRDCFVNRPEIKSGLFPRNDGYTIADIGTGSGCIIIALAKILPTISDKRLAISYYATDISSTALKVAKKNAKIHNVKIKFFQGNLLKPLKNKKIDIIIANLPYEPKKQNQSMTAETIGLKYEPKIALFAKKNGLYYYEKLLKQINGREQKPRLIFCEIDPGQKNSLKNLAKKYLPNYQIEIKKDLAGLNRVFILTYKKGSILSDEPYWPSPYK